jgi:hypothetical protein
MPIIERKRAACYDRFVNAVRPVLGLVTDVPLLCIQFESADEMRTLEFANGDPVPLETLDHGRMYFHAAQLLKAVPDEKRFRLETHKYWYRLQEQSGVREKAAIRWEYDKATPKDRYSRNHIQISAAAPIEGGSLDLNKLHLPTGYTTIEEVVRFLVYDLGVKPLSDDWVEVLAASERAFYTDFTSKRYGPDAADE